MPGTWEQGDGSPDDRSWLADWRRQVAALYAEVRALSTSDPAVAHRHWREVRERLFREHPQSPVPRSARAGFSRAAISPTTPSLRFVVPLQPAPPVAARRARPAAPQQRRRHPRVQPARPGRGPVRRPATVAVGVLDGGLRGRPVHPVPRCHERNRDLRGRAVPGRWGQERRPGRRSRRGHADPRLQLRVPAVVRLRSALGLSPGAAREPPRPRDPGRRATRPRSPRPEPGHRPRRHHQPMPPRSAICTSDRGRTPIRGIVPQAILDGLSIEAAHRVLGACPRPPRPSRRATSGSGSSRRPDRSSASPPPAHAPTRTSRRAPASSTRSTWPRRPGRAGSAPAARHRRR